MHGFSGGFEYGNMDADVKITVKHITTGQKYSGSSKTEEATPAVGVSLSYAKLPRSDFGLIIGGSLIKKTKDNENSDKNTLGRGGELMQLRPEMSVAYAFSNGIYGAAGGHLSVLKVDSDAITKLGYGGQLLIGYVSMRNLGIDIGYFLSRHFISKVETDGSSLVMVETNESYLDLKQLRGRISYYF